MLANSGKSAEAIAGELRKSSLARNTIKDAFKEFESTIKGQIETKRKSPMAVKRNVNTKKEDKN